jgi:methyl-accepting chemotaxis protein
MLSGDMPFFSKLLFLPLVIGLAAGAFLLLLVGLLQPAGVPLVLLTAACTAPLIVGLTVALYARMALGQWLRRQLPVLRPWLETAAAAPTVEGLMQSLQEVVARLERMAADQVQIADESIPHYRFLTDSSRFLSDRALDGLNAAQLTRAEITKMTDLQREVMVQTQQLAARAQDEAAISRELSASLEEMAGALEQSNSNFLETTASVDQMAASVREAAARTEAIARSVEGTTRDLDIIGESLEKIRAGSASSAGAADTVRADAEAGLSVVTAAMAEMDRIQEESRRAVQGTQQLAQQAEKVGKIVGVIKKLIGDTELLALNAAIIAAQAGVEGRGFAVVAEEIRALADRTTESAQGIQHIVSNIIGETGQVLAAVEATGTRIGLGRQLSHAAGDALRKIVGSSNDAAAASREIAELTALQGDRTRALLNAAGESLGSVRIIARAMDEQQIAITRIQGGAVQMKEAADRIAHGMEEQVRANRELDRGLSERGSQIAAISEATRLQHEAGLRVFQHFATSEERLTRNGERLAVFIEEIGTLEKLAIRLRLLSADEEKRRVPLGEDNAFTPAAVLGQAAAAAD